MDYFLFNFSGVQFHYTMSHLNIIPKEKIRTALRETLEYKNAKIVVIAHTAVSVARPKKAITGK